MPLLRLLFVILFLLNLLALAAGVGWLGTAQPRGEPERVSNQLNPQLIMLGHGSPTAESGAASATLPGSRESQARHEQPRAASAAPRIGGPAVTATTALPAGQSPAPAKPSLVPSIPEEAPSSAASVPVDTAAPHAEDISCKAVIRLNHAEANRIERMAHSWNPAASTERALSAAAHGWWVRIPPAGSRPLAEQRAQQLRDLGLELFIVRESGAAQHAISLGLFGTEGAARQHLADLQQRRVTDAELVLRHPASYRLEITASSAALAELALQLAELAPDAALEACSR